MRNTFYGTLVCGKLFWRWRSGNPIRVPGAGIVSVADAKQDLSFVAY